MTRWVAVHRKALVGAVVAGATAAAAALAAGSPWQYVALAAVGGALGIGVPVGAVPNRQTGG